ncbi:MAG: hypothetical protein QOH05_1370 [Acetobacteraceae bacterium]|nr:hypothetical protein [Acetobacteraceae bacterium]
MAESQLSKLKPYHPTTFLERGVALPFTTPRLAGTRARPTDKRGLELVILNPAGGRGVYIVPCTSITSFCRPTLHDAVFNGRVATLENVTPSMIRTVAREIAAEGLAGEDAREAAIRATFADRRERTVTNYQLVMALAEQVAHLSAVPASADGRVTLDPGTRARVMVNWISPRLGKPVAWTASALEDLAHVMAHIGAGSGSATGRVPRLVALLRQMRSDMAEWSHAQRDDRVTAYVAMVGVVADLTLSLTEATIEGARSLVGDMVSLLRTWAADPDSVTRLAGRSEWLLDGWEQICQLWNQARNDITRRAVLSEMVALIPILPKEVSEWSHSPSLEEDVLRFRRLVPMNEDWRTGAIVFDLIARNEAIRALAC